MSENGDHILMLNASGLPCTYASKAEDHDTVIPERITYANLSAPSSSRTVLWYPSM